jgi:hypothetical protein
MKLRDFASGDFVLEGWRKVQYWDEHDECQKNRYDNCENYEYWIHCVL